MKKFWCCYVEGTRGFSYQHETWESAVKEAKRLAQLPNNANVEVYVLEAKASCKTTCPPVKWEVF